MKSSLRYVEIVTPILLSLALLIQREDQNPSPPHSQSPPVVPVVSTIVGVPPCHIIFFIMVTFAFTMVIVCLLK